MVIASPWRRLVASLVDSLVLLPLSLLLMALAGVDPLGPTTWVQDLLFQWIPGWTVDWLTAFMREVVGKTLSTLPLGLGYLWAFFHPRRQAWHDLIADTLVVRASRPG
mgnify:CR=1 FL=1